MIAADARTLSDAYASVLRRTVPAADPSRSSHAHGPLQWSYSLSIQGIVSAQFGPAEITHFPAEVLAELQRRAVSHVDFFWVVSNAEEIVDKFPDQVPCCPLWYRP
jgi:hypothetical protein